MARMQSLMFDQVRWNGRNPFLKVLWRMFQVFCLLGFTCSMGVLVGIGGLFGRYAIFVQLGLLSAVTLVVLVRSWQAWRDYRVMIIETPFGLLGAAICVWYVLYTAAHPARP